MTNVFIHGDRTKYRYTIQDVETKMYYHGSRYARGCHPDEFWKPDGYITSSPTIHELVEQHGLERFIVRKIIIDGNAYENETKFLKKVNARQNPNFYNGHNNDGMAFGIPEFYEVSKQTCLEKYGVEYYTQTKEYKEKSINTSLDKYGVSHYSKTEEYKEKCINTSLDKYGVEYYSQTEEFKEQTKQTCLEKYGIDQYMKTDDFRTKSKETCLEKYGAESYSASEEGKTRYKEILLEKYGVINPSQMPEVKEKKKTSSLNKYGVENISQSDEVKAKKHVVFSMVDDNGVSGYDKRGGAISEKKNDPEWKKKTYKTCEYCGKTTDPGNFKKHHGDKCKEKKEWL